MPSLLDPAESICKIRLICTIVIELFAIVPFFWFREQISQINSSLLKTDQVSEWACCTLYAGMSGFFKTIFSYFFLSFIKKSCTLSTEIRCTLLSEMYCTL